MPTGRQKVHVIVSDAPPLPQSSVFEDSSSSPLRSIHPIRATLRRPLPTLPPHPTRGAA
jgi:hypothetical protein